MAIELSRETRQAAVASIQRFFAEQMDDDEIGELKASLLLDFCLREIGPSIYNRAIADAQAVLQERVADLDGTCYEPEFSYWTDNKKR
jgi:uncharacterized protein (DUF2164 family)